jgi:hypothetical protein
VPATDALTPSLALAVVVAAAVLAYLGAAAVFARRVVAPIWAGWRGVSPGAAQ